MPLILQSTPRSSQQSLTFTFPNSNFVHISHIYLICALHVPPISSVRFTSTHTYTFTGTSYSTFNALSDPHIIITSSENTLYTIQGVRKFIVQLTQLTRSGVLFCSLSVSIARAASLN
jgi:hypothetical protein